MINERVRVGAKPWVRSRSMTQDELWEGWNRARRNVNRHYLTNQEIDAVTRHVVALFETLHQLG